MRRFSAVWRYRSGVGFTDYTVAAGRSGANIDFQGGDKLYLGYEDWLSGMLTMVGSAPASPLTYTAALWDGDVWRELEQQEAYQELQSGFNILEQAYDFGGDGVLDWGRPRFNWREQVPSAGAGGWPEGGQTPPETVTPRFWVRVYATSGGPCTLDRLLPLCYNTYAAYSDLASFMGLPEFDEVHPPTATEVRRIIRRHEDWLDRYTRRSWRPRYVRNELHDFNPYGMATKRRPVMFLTEVGLWNGQSFETMRVGRGADVYIDPGVSMVYPLTPSFRLRYYSFLLSRYLRMPRSFRISYVYGEDFDNSDSGQVAQDIVLRRAAADLVISGDWSKFLTSGLDVLPKPEKVREWQEEAQDRADQLRGLWTA